MYKKCSFYIWSNSVPPFQENMLKHTINWKLHICIEIESNQKNEEEGSDKHYKECKRKSKTNNFTTQIVKLKIYTYFEVATKYIFKVVFFFRKSVENWRLQYMRCKLLNTNTYYRLLIHFHFLPTKYLHNSHGRRLYAHVYTRNGDILSRINENIKGKIITENKAMV